jgi:hypothetical protein
MIWVSALRLFFSRNLLDPAAEKTLLTHPVNRGGDYPAINHPIDRVPHEGALPVGAVAEAYRLPKIVDRARVALVDAGGKIAKVDHAVHRAPDKGAEARGGVVEAGDLPGTVDVRPCAGVLAAGQFAQPLDGVPWRHGGDGMGRVGQPGGQRGGGDHRAASRI